MREALCSPGDSVDWILENSRVYSGHTRDHSPPASCGSYLWAYSPQSEAGVGGIKVETLFHNMRILLLHGPLPYT